jgi:hypothetical protein
MTKAIENMIFIIGSDPVPREVIVSLDDIPGIKLRGPDGHHAIYKELYKYYRMTPQQIYLFQEGMIEAPNYFDPIAALRNELCQKYGPGTTKVLAYPQHQECDCLLEESDSGDFLDCIGLTFVHLLDGHTVKQHSYRV